MKKILLADNYDSFTYNLYDYLRRLGAVCKVIRNDAISFEALKKEQMDAIVLSPGPKTPREAGWMPQLIAHYHDKLPILGICLGHQGIGEYFGARLVRANEPVHGKTSLLTHNGHPLFEGLPDSFEVMRYHSLILDSLEGTGLNSIAQTPEGEIMAIAHQKWPITGVQFHPESILTEFGLELLENWMLSAPI